MSFTHRSIATVTFPYFPLNPPTPKTPNFTPLRSLNNNNKTLISVNPKSSFRIRASAASDSSQPPWWANLLPAQALGPDKVLRLISGATASPIGQYVSEPVTFLHSLDPRIKLVWLLALVVLPARSHIILRFGLVVYLAILSIWVLPRHAWMDQLGRVSLISGILFIMLGLGADGAPALVQLRTPPPAITGLSNIPASLAGYSYLIFKLGPIQFTRKGLSVASTAACLTFTVFQSASLCLTTTTPEELAFALRWFMLPLTNLGVPVAEIILTLMLSLRFISLVFDEVRNVALGIVSRRIDWQQLTMVETIDASLPLRFFSGPKLSANTAFMRLEVDTLLLIGFCIFIIMIQHWKVCFDSSSIRCIKTIFFAYFRRIFKNIFSHAEQISQAMIARGFRGDCNTHKMYLLSDPSIGIADVVSLLCLVGIIGAAVWSDYFLI